MAKKIEFTFRSPDGEMTDDLSVWEGDPETFERLTKSRERFYKVNRNIEREWVLKRLASTDYVEAPDATYKGEPLAGSSKKAEILTYRQALRDYDYAAFGDRPSPPEWYR